MLNIVKVSALVVLFSLAVNSDHDEKLNSVLFYWQSYYYYKGEQSIVDYSKLKIKIYNQLSLDYQAVYPYLEGPIDPYDELTESVQIQHTLTGYLNGSLVNTTVTPACTFFREIFNKIYLPMHLHHSNVSTAAPCPIPPGTSEIYPVANFSQLIAPSILEAGSYGVDIKFLCENHLCGGFGGDFNVQLF